MRGLEAGRGFTEIRAVGTDSSVLRNSGFEREALEMWGKAITPDEKFRAIKDIERRAFEIQVAHYVGRSDLGEQMKKLSDEDQRQVIKDLDSLRLDMYAQIDKRRAEVLRIARDPKRAYATMIDPEDGVQIVFDKRLRSQLSVAEPMLDMKVLQKTARLLVDDFAKQYDVTKDLVEAGKKTTRPGVSKRQGFRTGSVNALDTGAFLVEGFCPCSAGLHAAQLVRELSACCCNYRCLADDRQDAWWCGEDNEQHLQAWQEQDRCEAVEPPR